MADSIKQVRIVDFDRTLATHTEGEYDPSVAGKPIKKMVDRVKKWLADGEEVRIFSARVSSGNTDAQENLLTIQKWCREVFGRELPVTAEKGYDVSEIWDDRAVAVEPNTGEILGGASVGVGLKKKPNDFSPIEVEDVVCMVVDHGLFVETALRLAREYKKVYYCVPNSSPFPKMNESFIGYGYDEIELCESMFIPEFNQIDLFVFPDLGFGHEQAYLESIGKRVFGARMGEELETERGPMKEAFKKMGMPVGKYAVVKGMKALREYLKEHENVYVKISKYRGQLESFKSESYKIIEPMLDKIEYDLGAFKYIKEFVVEDELPDCVEIGIDAYTVDGKFPSVCLAGIEVKDQSYIGAIKNYSEFPEQIRYVNDALAPFMKEYGFRGLFSAELRIGKDKKPYLIDFCGRQPAPPGDLYQEMYTNLPEIFLRAAEGKMVDPVPAAKYGVQVNMDSQFAISNWQPVYFAEQYRPFIKFHNSCVIEGVTYIIPQSYGIDKIGAIIAFGNTLKQAIAAAKEIASTISGHGLKVLVDSLDEAEEEIEKSAKLGIKMI